MDNNPGLDIWHDDGKVSLVITDASIIEYKGALVPGIALTAIEALRVIEALSDQLALSLDV